MARLHFEAVPSDTAVRELGSRWRIWASQQHLSPFATPEFVQAWSTAFGETKTSFVVTGVRGTEPVFALPMWAPRDAPSQWMSLGEWRADYTEAAIVDDDPAIASAFWRWLEKRSGCKLAKVSRMPVESALSRGLGTATFERRGRAMRAAANLLTTRRIRYTTSERHHDHPYADAARVRELAPRIDAKYMRRNAKMLEKHGALSYVVLNGDAAASQLDTFFAMHVANFAATERTSQFASAEDRVFYGELIARGVAYMDALMVDARPVAMHVGFQRDDRLYYYKPTFELELSKASPGKLLLARIFERAAADRVNRVDLLKGNEPYKADWANHTRPTVTATVVDHGILELSRAMLVSRSSR